MALIMGLGAQPDWNTEQLCRPVGRKGQEGPGHLFTGDGTALGWGPGLGAPFCQVPPSSPHTHCPNLFSSFSLTPLPFPLPFPISPQNLEHMVILGCISEPHSLGTPWHCPSFPESSMAL